MRHPSRGVARLVQSIHGETMGPPAAQRLETGAKTGTVTWVISSAITRPGPEDGEKQKWRRSRAACATIRQRFAGPAPERA